MLDLIVFLISAAIVIAGALGVILSRNPVRAALSLIASFFAMAVLFVMQGAHFLSLVQVVVYAGAIVVLFLFVIMLLGVDEVEDLNTEPIMGQRFFSVLAGIGFFVLVCAGLFASGSFDRSSEFEDIGPVALSGEFENSPALEDESNISSLAYYLFTDNLLAFQATALLLTVVTLGAVILVKDSGAEEDLVGDD